MVLSYVLILPVSQLETQQRIMPQITSHIEYLMQAHIGLYCNIFVLTLYWKLMNKI